jgi:hypothetical protein
MKTTASNSAKTIQNANSMSDVARREAPPSAAASGRLAQLAAMMNQSPRVQAQLKLAEEIQNSERAQNQMSLAAEVNHAQAPPTQFRLREEDGPAQREEAPVPNRTGLPDQLKSGVESLSGLSLDDVKVHYDSDKPAQLNALAYAQGTDIHVAPGQEKHLAHEAWHIVQQKQGRVRPTMQMKTGTPVNDDPHLEREADVMGAQASRLTLAGAMTASVRSNTPADPGVAIAQRQEGGGAPKTESAAGADLEKTIAALKELLESRDEAEEGSDLEGYIAELEEIAENQDPALEGLALEALDEEAKTQIGSSLGKLIGGETSDSSGGEREVVQGFFLYDLLVRAAGWAYGNPIPVATAIVAVALIKIRAERSRRASIENTIQEALQGVADEGLRAQLLNAWQILKLTKGKASFVEAAKSSGGYERDSGKLVLNIAQQNWLQWGDTTIEKKGIVIHELTHVAEVIANTKGFKEQPKDFSSIMNTDIAKPEDIVGPLFDLLDKEEDVFKAVTFWSSAGKTMYNYVDERLKYAFQEGLTPYEFPTVVNQLVYVMDQKASEMRGKKLKDTQIYQKLKKLQTQTKQSRTSRSNRD